MSRTAHGDGEPRDEGVPAVGDFSPGRGPVGEVPAGGCASWGKCQLGKVLVGGKCQEMRFLYIFMNFILLYFHEFLLTLPQPALPPTGNSIENLSPPTAGTPGMKINLVSQESENFVQSLVVDLIFYSPLLLNGYFRYSDFSAEIQKVIKYAFISRKRLVQLSGGFKRLLKFKKTQYCQEGQSSTHMILPLIRVRAHEC